VGSAHCGGNERPGAEDAKESIVVTTDVGRRSCAPAERLLVGLEAFTAATGLVGGLLLALRPDGSLVITYRTSPTTLNQLEGSDAAVLFVLAHQQQQ
jgi:hypothetical protein